MLPIISIDIKDVCRSESSPSGLTYLFDFNKVENAARSEGMNLDSFLTLKIASVLTQKKLLSNLLLCYTPYRGLFILTICSKHNADLPDISSSLPGCLESGREDFLPELAAPFIFYGGLQIYRLYSVRRHPIIGYYVCDCALCDLPHAKREGWVRGEKRVSAFATTQKTAKVEKDVHRQKGYSLYLRLYRRGETDFFIPEQSFSLLSDSGYYVCDMGCLYGMCLAAAQKDDYENVRDRPDQHVGYSTVPIEPSEEFKVGGINFTLQHALCNWTR